MSALSRGLISGLRHLSLNTVAAATTSSASMSYHFLNRLFSSEALVNASQISHHEECISRNIEAKPGVMTPNSKRTGLIAVKCGMSALWDKWGERVPATVLWVDDNIVSMVKTPAKDCTTALQVKVLILSLKL